MRTYRSVLAAALLVLASVVVAAPASAATAPLAPAALHPDGVGFFEQVAFSPVGFSASAAAGDSAGATGRVRYAVQQRVDGAWQDVASVLADHAEQIPLPDGDTRWRARFVATGGTTGPWSPWIRFTVDSRRPADPTVSIPDTPAVEGVPVPVTITSPDGLAAIYYLADFGGGPSFGQGQDPCAVPHTVCVAAGQTQVTMPWTFLRYGFTSLSVTTYARNGYRSPDTVDVDPGLVDHDAAALTHADRWVLPASDSAQPVSVANVQRGRPALRLGPASTAVTQTLQDHSTDPPTDTAVPSASLATSPTARTVKPVVDTATSFSVGGVFTKPASAHGDLTVLDQPGVGGTAFSLVLLSTDYWRFCATTTAGETSCSLMASGFDPSDVVVGRYDAVRGEVSVAVGRREDGTHGFPHTAPLRPASGSLRFGAAAVPDTSRYTGPLGSPIVAHGWVDPDQLVALLTGAT